MKTKSLKFFSEIEQQRVKKLRNKDLKNRLHVKLPSNRSNTFQQSLEKQIFQFSPQSLI